MTLSVSDIFHKRAQARFIQDMARRGSPYTLAYGGRWQADAQGHVARATVAPSQRRVMGSLTLGPIPSSEVMERVKKLGVNWVPDGYALLPVTAPTVNLVTLTDERAGVTYDVTQALPDSYGENVYRTVLLRDGAVYNRAVSVAVDSPDKDEETVIFTNLPCRLFFESPNATGMQQGGDYNFGATATGAPMIEFPPVYNAAGKVVLLDPKATIIRDDPELNGASGDVIAYRVAGLNLDPGGEGHSCKYALSYMPQ